MPFDADHRYRERYYWALERAGITEFVAWEELTPDQRQNVRDEVHRYAREMDELGKSISRS
jgi:predicted Fe-S protein YdhL (DUF1289 family)